LPRTTYRVLDPLSLIIKADLAELLLIEHSYDKSIRRSRKTIEMDPNFALAHNQLGQAYLQKQMNEDAITELAKSGAAFRGQPNLPG
jgi:tetratricopeptide (TPR) repeat protein